MCRSLTYWQDDCITRTESLDDWVTLHKLRSVSIPSTELSERETLSNTLLGTLPSREDIEIVYKAREHVSIFFHSLGSLETMPETPSSNSHPTLIAKHMLLLATFLQHLHPAVHEEIRELSETPRVIVQRLASTAISLVTTNDELVGSIEGLECVHLEAEYWLNWGNLRRSLVALRRAVVIAQLMGLHRWAQPKVLDPKTRVDPRALWYQILHCERILCLQLGLPQASHDHSMASEAMLASDTPIGRLQRMHSVLSSQILTRNESNSSYQDFAQTQKLDTELSKAANLVPSKWWLPPHLPSVVHNSSALCSETRRLVAQISHYNLLNLLHLPHLLRSSAEHKCEYSRMVCVHASREMLTRFIAFRSFNRIASSFRVIDFLAFVAGLTLPLAHLDSHRFSTTENLLAHQCFSDRALLDKVQETMLEVGALNADPLSVQSADMIKRLAAIEVQVAEGKMNPAANLQSPLLGQNIETKDEHDNRIMPDTNGGCIVSELCARFGIIQMSDLSPSQALGGVKPFDAPDLQVAGNAVDEQPLFPLLDTLQYSSLTAGLEDWAFQGVDMAFVDSLMRGAGDDSAEWLNWQDQP